MKKIFFAIGFVVILFIGFNHQLIFYGLSQGYGEFRILWASRPIKEVLKDESIADSIKTKLRLIEEIKQFAIDSIGLKDSKNYSTFCNQKMNLWVLTASEKYNLQPFEWSFPFAGRVSYKGFFNKSNAIKEEEELHSKGYDTDIGIAGAWSTLGWFRDPILSDMLKRSEGKLANLVIHELTHETLYIKDSTSFNENLASFVGDEGARLFLRNKYGISSSNVNEYEQSMEKEKKVNEMILKGAEKLDGLYNSFQRNLKVDSIKDRLKRECIVSIIDEIDSIRHAGGNMTPRTHYPNNTFFMDCRRYESKRNNFEKEYVESFNSRLRKLVEHYKLRN